MPLADVGGVVAVGFKEFGDGGFAREKVGPLGLIMNPGINTGADMVATGEKGGARWRTDGAA